MKLASFKSAPNNRLDRDVSLIVKDGVREFRSVARLGAKRFVNHFAEGGKPVPSWAPPLGQVARMAMNAVDGLDRLAVTLISSTNDYRQMKFRLLSIDKVLGRTLPSGSAREFEHNFYWIFKHLLELEHRDDVVVREESMHLAGQLFKTALNQTEHFEISIKPGQTLEVRAQRLAMLAQSLCISRPLRVHAVTQSLAKSHFPSEKRPFCDDETEDSLTQRLALAAVLAGEIAAAYQRSTLQEEVMHALQMSVRIATSRSEEFVRAMASPRPLDNLTRELAFVLRHI